ncbi:MAG: VanZ family protein [Bacteroidota bacterium]
MFNQHLYKPLLIVLIAAIAGWLFIKIIFHREKKRTVWEDLAELLFVLYGIVVAAVTIVPLPFAMHKTAGAQGINLVPLKNTIAIVRNVINANKDFLLPHLMQNIVGNVLLFIPLGFLLPVISRKKISFLKVLLIGLFSSVAIESIQWIERGYGVYRSVDVDDVILNTVGTLLGWVGFYIARIAIPGISKK